MWSDVIRYNSLFYLLIEWKRRCFTQENKNERMIVECFRYVTFKNVSAIKISYDVSHSFIDEYARSQCCPSKGSSHKKRSKVPNDEPQRNRSVTFLLFCVINDFTNHRYCTLCRYLCVFYLHIIEILKLQITWAITE